MHRGAAPRLDAVADHPRARELRRALANEAKLVALVEHCALWVRVVRMMVRRKRASTIGLRRSLPTRTINVGTPSMGAMATLEQNATRARVCENRTKTMPVARAVTTRPATHSMTTSTFARRVVGVIAP